MEKEKKSNQLKSQAGKVLNMTELFDVPIERLFKAWTNKKDFMSWYGPEGFKVIHCEMNVKVGGHWRACIKSERGDEYWMQGTYIEIVDPSRLVFTYGDGSRNANVDETLVTISFVTIGNKTQMHFQQTNFPNDASRISHHGGWSSAFTCLREFAEKL